MKEKLPLIARVLLGLVFTVFGMLGLLNLIPPPPDLPERMQAFTNGLAASIYFMPFLKAVEASCGLLLLSGLFVPLALVILAPIVIHIFLVHAVLEPNGLPIAIVIGLLMIYLSFFAKPYSDSIKILFKKK